MLLDERATVLGHPVGHAETCTIEVDPITTLDRTVHLSRTPPVAGSDEGVALVLQQRYVVSMTRTISQRELRNDSGAIMRALDRGEVFLVTRNGIPVGELRPARRRFVSRDLLYEAFANAAQIDAERFRNEVDAVLDQAPEPRA